MIYVLTVDVHLMQKKDVKLKQQAMTSPHKHRRMTSWLLYATCNRLSSEVYRSLASRYF